MTCMRTPRCVTQFWFFRKMVNGWLCVIQREVGLESKGKFDSNIPANWIVCNSTLSGDKGQNNQIQRAHDTGALNKCYWVHKLQTIYTEFRIKKCTKHIFKVTRTIMFWNRLRWVKKRRKMSNSLKKWGICSITHFWLVSWAIFSRSLIPSEQPELIPHSRSFVPSNSLTLLRRNEWDFLFF